MAFYFKFDSILMLLLLLPLLCEFLCCCCCCYCCYCCRCCCCVSFFDVVVVAAIIAIIIIVVFVVFLIPCPLPASASVVASVVVFIIFLSLFLSLFDFQFEIEEIYFVRRIVCVLNMIGHLSKRIPTYRCVSVHWMLLRSRDRGSRSRRNIDRGVRVGVKSITLAPLFRWVDTISYFLSH